jgi:hypothetical protein
MSSEQPTAEETLVARGAIGVPAADDVPALPEQDEAYVAGKDGDDRKAWPKP